MKSLLVTILSFLSALPIIPFSLKLALVRLNYRFKHILPGEREFLFTHYHGTISVYIKPMYPIEREMATGTYDRVSCEVIATFVKPDSLVVDVGANAGALTLYIAQLLRTGTVVAIEPGPPIFARLRRNIDLNPELRKRIVPLHMGVSDSPGVLHWAEDPNNRGNAGMLNPEGEAVSVVTMDGLYRDGVISGADFIKIDIEGMELEALRGATELIRQQRPVIYFETLEPFRAVRGFDVFGEICALFHSLNYDLWGVDDKGRFIPLEDLRVLKYPNTLAVPVEKRQLVAGSQCC